MLLLAAAVAPAHAADLDARTLAAYERHVADVEKTFLTHIDGDPFLVTDLASIGVRGERPGRVLVRPGANDGIFDVEDGLIHHWRGAAFIPDATLKDVLAVTQDVAAYPDIYPWILDVRLFDRSEPARDDQYRVLLQMQGRAGGTTSVVDLWTSVTYRYPRPDRAAAISDVDCVRQVENAGEPDERLLAPGTGSGFLWRANTYAKYLERDGGVYVELENLGLSRDYPPLLGWVIEPFARRLGRGSVERSLVHLRAAVRARISGNADDRAGTPVTSGRLPAFWCTP